MTSQLSIPVLSFDGTSLSVRTEHLERYEVTVCIDPLHFDAHGEAIKHELMAKLENDLDLVGRIVHGDVTFQRYDDFLRNTVVFKAVAQTRESPEGEWPAIHQALREDAEELRQAVLAWRRSR